MSAPRTGPGYETSDAHARPLLLFVVGLLVLLALSLAVAAWLDRYFTRGIRAGESASPVSELRRAPDGPELQSVPGHELGRMRAWEEEQLTGTAWVDPLNGIVRIPVERAMELCLEEGFPVRAGGDR